MGRENRWDGTTPTDSRSRRSRTSRRGGHLLTRALSPLSKNGLPIRFPRRTPVPDGRTVTPDTTAGPAKQHAGLQWAFIPGTNSIESLNYQLRKIIKNRGHFPSDTAAIKLLWLAIMNIEDKRARERAKQASRPKSQQNPPPRLVEGGIVQGWKAALAELALIYPQRINPYL
jgi:Transposase, Mutator family